MFAGLDPETAPELPMRGVVVAADFLSEDAPDPKLARRLERQDDAAGRRPGDEVDEGRPVASPSVLGKEPAQLARRGRVLEDLELLEIGIPMAPALEQEVPLAERPGASEQRLRPEGGGVPQGGVKGGSNGGHGSESTRRRP